jgi:hypothetical protein
MNGKTLARWMSGLVLLLSGFLAAASWAEAHGGIPNVIHTCFKKTGEVRFVHPDETCGQHETPWDWLAA